MANYLIVVVKKEKLDLIKTWVNENLADTFEILKIKISNNVFLLYISKEAVADSNFQKRFIFKGTGISYSHESIFFGADGVTSLIENQSDVDLIQCSAEGSYVYARWTNDRLLISNDTFSMCSVLYFSDKNIIAASDSLFLLTQLRKACGLPCTMHEEVALARSWSNTMAGQLLSEDTLVQEIKYLQIGGFLQIRFNDELSVKRCNYSHNYLFELVGYKYEDIIKIAVQRIASLIHSLASISPNTVRIALSGGLDSRVILGCALASPKAREHAIFNCTNNSPANQEDYKVVSALSQRFEFPLGLRDKKIKRYTKTQVSNPLNLWFLANAGLYDFLVAPNYFLKPIGIFGFGGFGAEIYKGMYGWRPISRIASSIKNDLVRGAFAAQCEKGIEALGMEADDPTGSEWHYLAFRNAIHSGRSTMTSMSGMRPLMQKELVALTRSVINPFPTPGKADKNIISDLLIAANPELAKFPFDSPNKNMSANYVHERSKLFEGGLHEDDLTTYKMYGNYKEVQNGCPKLFFNLADKFNSSPLSQQNIGRLMDEGYERISSPTIQAVYDTGYRSSKLQIEESKSSLTSLRSYPGKLMSFLLLNP